MHTIPDYLTQLIDRAAEKAGSDYALAKMLSQNRSAISMWRAGTRSCPVEDQVLMASIAGLDAGEWAARALVAKHEGTAKGDALFKALGKALLVTGAAIGSAGVSAMGTYSTTHEPLNTICIMSSDKPYLCGTVLRTPAFCSAQTVARYTLSS